MSTRPAFTCQQLVELVTDYLDGRLPAAERLAFERHVAICPPCRGYFGQLRRIAAVSGGLREDDVPERLRDDVLTAFRDWRSETAS